MMHFRDRIAKLLANPLSLPILQLLTNSQLSIPQITKSLKNIDVDMPTVIAVLGELCYFGLVERVHTPIFNSSAQNQINSQRKEEKSFQESRLFSPTPFGIPVYDQVSLWEEVLQQPNQSNFNGMGKWIFSIPESLRKEIKDLTLEEMQERLLNKG